MNPDWVGEWIAAEWIAAEEFYGEYFELQAPDGSSVSIFGDADTIALLVATANAELARRGGEA